MSQNQENEKQRPSTLDGDLHGTGLWDTYISEQCIWHEFRFDSEGHNPGVSAQFSLLDDDYVNKNYQQVFHSPKRRKCSKQAITIDLVEIIYAVPDAPDAIDHEVERTLGYKADHPVAIDLTLERDGARGYLSLGLVRFATSPRDDTAVRYLFTGTLSGGLSRHCHLADSLRCKNGTAFEGIQAISPGGLPICTIRENSDPIEVDRCRVSP